MLYLFINNLNIVSVIIKVSSFRFLFFYFFPQPKSRFFSAIWWVSDDIKFQDQREAMPCGKRISLQMREIISRLYLELNYSVREVFVTLFNSDPALCSLQYLGRLCNALRLAAFRETYLIGGPKSSGRPLSLSYFNRLLIQHSVLSNKTRRLCEMYQEYCVMFYPDNDVEDAEEEDNAHHRLSLSTFGRTLKRQHISRKIIERRNINQNPVEGLEFLDSIAHINPIFMIDIDESKQDRQSRELKFGYAPEGEACIKDQIIINNTAYSTIAAVTPMGFMD